MLKYQYLILSRHCNLGHLSPENLSFGTGTRIEFNQSFKLHGLFRISYYRMLQVRTLNFSESKYQRCMGELSGLCLCCKQSTKCFLVSRPLYFLVLFEIYLNLTPSLKLTNISYIVKLSLLCSIRWMA